MIAMQVAYKYVMYLPQPDSEFPQLYLSTLPTVN